MSIVNIDRKVVGENRSRDNAGIGIPDYNANMNDNLITSKTFVNSNGSSGKYSGFTSHNVYEVVGSPEPKMVVYATLASSSVYTPIGLDINPAASQTFPYVSSANATPINPFTLTNSENTTYTKLDNDQGAIISYPVYFDAYKQDDPAAEVKDLVTSADVDNLISRVDTTTIKCDTKLAGQQNSQRCDYDYNFTFTYDLDTIHPADENFARPYCVGTATITYGFNDTLYNTTSTTVTKNTDLRDYNLDEIDTNALDAATPPIETATPGPNDAYLIIQDSNTNTTYQEKIYCRNSNNGLRYYSQQIHIDGGVTTTDEPQELDHADYVHKLLGGLFDSNLYYTNDQVNSYQKISTNSPLKLNSVVNTTPTSAVLFGASKNFFIPSASSEPPTFPIEALYGPIKVSGSISNSDEIDLTIGLTKTVKNQPKLSTFINGEETGGTMTASNMKINDLLYSTSPHHNEFITNDESKYGLITINKPSWLYFEAKSVAITGSSNVRIFFAVFLKHNTKLTDSLGNELYRYTYSHVVYNTDAINGCSEDSHPHNLSLLMPFGGPIQDTESTTSYAIIPCITFGRGFSKIVAKLYQLDAVYPIYAPDYSKYISLSGGTLTNGGYTVFIAPSNTNITIPHSGWLHVVGNNIGTTNNNPHGTRLYIKINNTVFKQGDCLAGNASHSKFDVPTKSFLIPVNAQDRVSVIVKKDMEASGESTSYELAVKLFPMSSSNLTLPAPIQPTVSTLSNTITASDQTAIYVPNVPITSIIGKNTKANHPILNTYTLPSNVETTITARDSGFMLISGPHPSNIPQRSLIVGINGNLVYYQNEGGQMTYSNNDAVAQLRRVITYIPIKHNDKITIMYSDPTANTTNTAHVAIYYHNNDTSQSRFEDPRNNSN